MNESIEIESVPALVDPPLPHPRYNPCSGCPRWGGETIIKYGKITLDTITCKVQWRGIPMPTITMAEYRVLSRLVFNHGRPVTYRLLYDDLKEMPGFIAGCGEDGYKGNMRSAVKRIRRKFERIEPGWNNIENHMGYGYSWNMD